MERGRGASEVTRDESEEEEEVERRRPRREGAARDNYRESRNYVSGGANGRANILTRGGDAREVSGEVLAGMELLLFHTGWMRVVRRRGVEWASRIR
jgi:hypothetical protein